MKSQKFGTSTEAYFGDGMRSKAVEILGLSDDDHVLVVTSKGSLGRPQVAELIESLRASSRVSIFTSVKPNPRTSDIDECTNLYSESGVSMVLGIGGGSALDQAKATSMTLELRETVAAVLARKDPLPLRNIKLVLMPTTSGTGAELSYGAILTDEVKSEKLGLRGANLAADIAIVDPELTFGVPAGITMTTGFDVLTHALETWLSNKANEFTRDLSEKALKCVFQWLPVLAEDPSHKKARHEMSYASMIMGANLALSTTCLPHRLQYPIGAATDTAHADGLAAIYPAWLDCELGRANDKLAECACWVGVSKGDDISVNAALFCKAVIDLMRTTNMQVNLTNLGITDDLVEVMPSQVSGTLDTDPCYAGPDTIRLIYRNSFDGTVPVYMKGISQ